MCNIIFNLIQGSGEPSGADIKTRYQEGDGVLCSHQAGLIVWLRRHVLLSVTSQAAHGTVRQHREGARTAWAASADKHRSAQLSTRTASSFFLTEEEWRTLGEPSSHWCTVGHLPISKNTLWGLERRCISKLSHTLCRRTWHVPTSSPNAPIKTTQPCLNARFNSRCGKSKSNVFC